MAIPRLTHSIELTLHTQTSIHPCSGKYATCVTRRPYHNRHSREAGSSLSCPSRQAQIMARQGVLIDRATLAFWVGYAAAEIAPVVRRLKEIVLSSARIFADETTVKVLDPGHGKTKQGYFWVAARDDRACGGADPPAVPCPRSWHLLRRCHVPPYRPSVWIPGEDINRIAGRARFLGGNRMASGTFPP